MQVHGYTCMQEVPLTILSLWGSYTRQGWYLDHIPITTPEVTCKQLFVRQKASALTWNTLGARALPIFEMSGGPSSTLGISRALVGGNKSVRRLQGRCPNL